MSDDLRSFTVTGYAASDVGAQPHLALVSDQGVWDPEAMRLDLATGRFEADFALTRESWGDTVARETGAYSLRLLHGNRVDAQPLRAGGPQEGHRGPDVAGSARSGTRPRPR